jgi:hypothetical protein
MSLSKSKCWNSNNGLHFQKHGVPLSQVDVGQDRFKLVLVFKMKHILLTIL